MPFYMSNSFEWHGSEEMEVYLIRLGYQDRYGHKRKMAVVTTLIEAKLFDGIELHSLIVLTASHIVDDRPFQTEPRTVKQRPKPFALLM